MATNDSSGAFNRDGHIPPETLDGGDVHVWTADPVAYPPWRQEFAEAVLSADEMRQCRRFLRHKDQRLYLAAHAELRAVLSRYADVPPAAWRFDQNAFGKPSIQANIGVPSLHFNLSHTDGLVVIGVAACPDVGVDVEKVRRVDDLYLIAERVYAASEIALLRAAGENNVDRSFMQLWTLKEAFAKAKGEGLSLDFRAFDFASFSACCCESGYFTYDESAGAQWRLATRAAGPSHLLSVAHKAAPGPWRVTLMGSSFDSQCPE